MAARKRELIEPHKGDKRYVRRNKKGELNEVVDVGRSLSADRSSKSNWPARRGLDGRAPVPFGPGLGLPREGAWGNR